MYRRMFSTVGESMNTKNVTSVAFSAHNAPHRKRSPGVLFEFANEIANGTNIINKPTKNIEI